jgi:hypothetical protein
MAYVVPRGPDRFEIRETLRTERGPRSRTLATFRALTPDVIARARERARGTIDDQELRRRARRAGADVAEPAVDVAAAELYRELSDGAQLRPVLARLIASGLAQVGDPTAAERAAGAWLARSPDERGRAVHDLLALADRLPATRRGAALRFPRLVSTR